MDNQELTPEHKAFKSKLELYLAETQLSYTAASKVLDVSPGALKDWYRTHDGKIRKPAGHIMRAAELKIDRMNEMNKDAGIYNQLHGLSPNDRVAFLRGQLQGYEKA